MKTTNILSLAFSVALLAAPGCSAVRNSEPGTVKTGSAPQADSAALQGTWKGQELGGETEGPCYLTISGKNLDFRGADPQEWYKGTFSLRADTNPNQLVVAITDCCAPEFIGKMDYAIYRIEGGTLMITAFKPGTPNPPSDFNDSEARRFVFKGK
jgi:uncharacterized protein (TIGR03067 family)